MNRRFEYLSVATAIGGFLAVSYVACVAWNAVFPQWAMRGAWAQLLPGFEWLSIGTFLLGLVETFAYGFWFALVVPVARWMNRRFAAVPPMSPT